jgi:hypothetical protein
MEKFICPACGMTRRRTFHHICPRRFFNGSEDLQPLCARCHQELEKLIPVKERQTIEWYYQIVEDFLYTKQKERESQNGTGNLSRKRVHLSRYERATR